jgi:hypothetical protein
MQQGLTDERLESEFIGSQEFYVHSGGTDRSWVDGLYIHLLGRLADGFGENAWIQVLASGASRSQVALGFAASAERESQRVQDDYFRFLGRSASAADVNNWVGGFKFGLTNEDIITGFVASDEYYSRKTANF